MSPVCKMADNRRLTVDQKVKVVLFYAETKSVVATQRRFGAHFGTRWTPCKQTIYRLSLGTIFQPVRINSVPDVICFVKLKCVMFIINGMTFHTPLCILISGLFHKNICEKEVRFAQSLYSLRRKILVERDNYEGQFQVDRPIMLHPQVV